MCEKDVFKIGQHVVKSKCHCFVGYSYCKHMQSKCTLDTMGSVVSVTNSEQCILFYALKPELLKRLWLKPDPDNITT